MTTLRVGSLLLASLFLTTCQSARPIAEDGITGVYRLVKVDGSPVPAAVSHDGANLRVLSGTFTITAEGTCLSKTVFAPGGREEMTREVRANYEREGSRLTMRWEGAGVTEGTVEGNTLVMDNHGMIFEYTRQS